MSKYSTFYVGEYRDWHFKIDSEGRRHCFYLGNFLIGLIFKDKRNKWTAVPTDPIHRTGTPSPVCGFGSRHAAAKFCLQVSIEDYS